jgi:CheY-like chemotaxis protein
MHVLIVAGEKKMAELLKKVLEEENYSANLAFDRRDALDTVPDIINEHDSGIDYYMTNCSLLRNSLRGSARFRVVVLPAPHTSASGRCGPERGRARGDCRR